MGRWWFPGLMGFKVEFSISYILLIVEDNEREAGGGNH